MTEAISELVAEGISTGISFIAVDILGKDTYVKAMTAIGSLIGGAGGYVLGDALNNAPEYICNMQDETMCTSLAFCEWDGTSCAATEYEAPCPVDPLLYSIGGALIFGAVSGIGAFITGSVAEVVNPYIKERL